MPDEEPEVKEVETKEEPVVEKKPDEPEQSEVEKLAMKIGWNPNHKEGDRDYKTAEEFILSSKDIQTTQTKQNKSLKREIDDLKRSIGNLRGHYDTFYGVQVKALKSRIKDLQVRKKEAVEDGDSEAVAMIDNQINEINAIPDALPQDNASEPSEEFIEWQDENEWYTEDPEMHLYADKIGQEYAQKGLPLKKVFELVTRDVKKIFPEKFESQKKEEPVPKKKTPQTAPVEGATETRRSSAKSKYTIKDLSDEQKAIAKDFAAKGIMTVEQYIEQLTEIEKNRGLV